MYQWLGMNYCTFITQFVLICCQIIGTLLCTCMFYCNTMHKCRAFVNSPFSHVPAAVPPDLGIIPTEIRGKSPWLKTAEALEE